jgi:TFIIF-interacting CTD phosphatase-like protein
MDYVRHVTHAGREARATSIHPRSPLLSAPLSSARQNKSEKKERKKKETPRSSAMAVVPSPRQIRKPKKQTKKTRPDPAELSR